MRLPRLASALVLTLVWVAATAPRAGAGAFIFAENNGADVIAHPAGYTGSGGTITVSVCIDPSSANAASMVVPVQNIVATWNARAVVQPNLVFGAANNIGAAQYDFESVALHELGHCIGLAHPNLSSESGLTGSDQNYTKSTAGADGTYDLGIGADGVRGSADDLRDDDTNLHWFRRSDDNPFNTSATADITTYARSLAFLPAGHTFAANADRGVGAALGFANTEAVMQQGTFNDEAQRELAADDVATLKLGMSGLDMTAGTADDYTLVLTYGGLSASCNVVLDFDDARTSFATCYTSGAFINSTHVRITAGNIYFATGYDWFFNPVSSSPTTTTTSTSSTSTSSSSSSTTSSSTSSSSATTSSSSTSSSSTTTSSSMTSSTSGSSSTVTTTSTSSSSSSATSSSATSTSSTTSSSSSTTSSSAPPASTVTTTTTSTTLVTAGCTNRIQPGCVEAMRGTLLINEKIPARPRFKVLMKGLTAPLEAADFGDPVAGGTSYAVCLYDGHGGSIGGFTLEAAGASCGAPGRPCWRRLRTLGFRYVDRNGTEHGIQRVLLRGGAAGTGKALVRARLVPGRSQSGLPPGMPLRLVDSGLATVQLMGSNGPCFSLTADQVLGADAGRFSARRR